MIEFKRTRQPRPFEEIVRRYGGMVYAVCFQIVRNRHDAEDATQAVFLALAMQCRKDASIKYLGRWLQQVARRTSLDIKRARQRRGRREHQAGQVEAACDPPVDQAQQLTREELNLILRDQVSQLPPRYRTPLILHYFGGQSQSELAAELGCSARTLAVRLFRGREMLAKSLTRRGITISTAALTAALADTVYTAVSDGVLTSTASAAARMALGQSIQSAVSAQVLNLAGGATASLPAWNIMRFAFVLIVLVGSAIAAAPDAIRARIHDLSLPKMQWFDSTRLFERMLRTVAPRPRFTAAVPDETTRANPAANLPDADEEKRDSLVFWGSAGAHQAEKQDRPVFSSLDLNRGLRGFHGYSSAPSASSAIVKPSPGDFLSAPLRHVAPVPTVVETRRASMQRPGPPAPSPTVDSPTHVARHDFLRPAPGSDDPSTVPPESAEARDLIVVSDPSQWAFVQTGPGPVRSGTDWNSGYNVVANSGGFAIRADNRVRITLHEMPHDATARISLVSLFDGEAPALPEGHRLLSMWKLDADAEFSLADLMVHYDSKLVQMMGLPEEHLKLWVYQDEWIRLDGDVSFSRDLAADLLRARATGDFTYIAVSAPEPGGIFILTIAGGALLLRRNRKG